MFEKLKKFFEYFEKFMWVIIIIIFFIVYGALCIYLFTNRDKARDFERDKYLTDTINELQAENSRLAEYNRKLEFTVAELQTRNSILAECNREFENAIKELSRITAGAGGDLQGAFKTLERIRNLATKIKD